MNPGTIVRCRNRDWVLLPSEQDDVALLRALTGAADEVVAVHKSVAALIGCTLPEENIRSAVFPPPSVDDLADAASAHLLWQAARLTLREGATPFRSLGRVSIRPRVYQFVPLLMALRLGPVRMLIADDVGVGKTIEALLVVRELLDRGEIKRLCVLCPPCLCEQWHRELAEKFNLDSVVIRAGTISQLERRKTGPDSIYRHYPIQVASIDFLKTDRNKHQFLLDCPELVIVDEAHSAAAAAGPGAGQQQRHQLVQEIAARPEQHLVLLTATPHSGIDSAFRSLLSLLRPEFGAWDIGSLGEAHRIELARHFVQRTRRDIEREWEGEHCFPRRDSVDETYRLSAAYKDLFARAYDFCAEIVRAGQGLGATQRRVRYWGALALLRCVMSSPGAALATLETRHNALPTMDDDVEFRPFVFEFNALFLRRSTEKQPEAVQGELDFDEPDVESFHQRWALDAEREKTNRTRFAQRALRPDEVRRELEATDAVRGDAGAVREFVLNAAQRLGLSVAPDKRDGVFRVALSHEATVTLPAAVRFALPKNKSGHWLISFVSPTPERAEYLGRNHPFVAALARFLMEEALAKGAAARASRCGVVCTRAVSRLTTVVLLLIRYLLQQPERAPLLSEEVHVTGFTHGGAGAAVQWLGDDEALVLLEKARPDANLPMPEKRERIAAALERLPALDAELHARIGQRAAALEKSHKRVRQAVSLKVRQLAVAPQLPPDLLGVLVLQPVVG